MNFYEINWNIGLTPEYANDLTEFVTKLTLDKTYYFLYLKIVTKQNSIEITGYSLQSSSDTEDDCIL